MANLESLIRYHRYQLDEKQKRLGVLNAQLTALEDELQALIDACEKEKHVAKSDTFLAQALPGYLKAFEKRKEKQEKAIKDKAKEVDAAQDDIREAFAELKKYEIIQRRRDEEAEAEILKQENAELDELAIQHHDRKIRSEQKD